jgi:hypothetical protein
MRLTSPQQTSRDGKRIPEEGIKQKYKHKPYLNWHTTTFLIVVCLFILFSVFGIAL